MKNKYFIFLVVFACMLTESTLAQFSLEGTDWEVKICKEGKILNYKSLLNGKFEDIQFRNDEYAGPAFEGVQLSIEDKEQLIFSGKKENLKYSVQYKNENGKFLVIAAIENKGSTVHSPKYKRLILGLDTYMDKYPDWNYRFFPTMLRSEKTHFIAYAMSPLGRVLAFSSPDPLASWNYEYHNNQGNYKHYENAFHTGHRIYTVSLDLIHCLPLPERHPQYLNSIKPGEKVSFKLYMKELSDLNELNEFYSETTNAPAVNLDLYTVAANDNIKGTVISDSDLEITVFGPQNLVKTIEAQKVEDGLYSFNFNADRGVGEYKIVVKNHQEKVSEAMAFCRNPWSWYLNQARSEALLCKPTSTPHAECFYPFYSYFLARKHLPNQKFDNKAEDIFQKLFFELFDPETKEMRNNKSRIQNAATMIGILTDRYQVTDDIQDMENAAGLVEVIIRGQGEDGAYYRIRNNNDRRHYTSVIYIAKSIMEYLVSARDLADKYPEWKKKYNRHLLSVNRALDDLARRGDDVKTEGEMTFEDGMISCSATQLALGALRTTNEVKKEKYKKASLLLTDKHRCLTLLKIPDSRMRGGTLRFWETQYTVTLMHGMMNTPCGWSAWKTYGIWYQYLLTGNEDFLKLTVNALGSFMQLVDHQSGKLRFSFAPDPYIETMQFLETPIGSGKTALQPIITGEQYIDMMSYWHRFPHPTYRQKWGIDNFVHEVFKCMEEIILTNAYVVEQADGSFNTYNCELIKKGKQLTVKSKDLLVDKLHVNLKNIYDVKFQSKTTESFNGISGLRWVGAMPDDIKEYEIME